MKHLCLVLLASLLVLGLMSGSITQAANSNSDYSGVSPFVSATVTPNILILMDNSGSMGYRASCDDTTNQSSPNFNLCPGGGLFDQTKTYTGTFDPLACYTYDSAAGNTRFAVSGAAKAAIGTACSSTLWDGNFLNWVTYRRGDALKKALIGGYCAVNRAADGSCPPSGSPALITLKGQDSFGSTCCANLSTARIPTGSGANKANGRVPTAVQTLGASPSNLVFHLRGTNAPAGSFCVANPSDGLMSSTAGSCSLSGGSGFTEQQFWTRAVVSVEPLGVIQDLGDKARFGLLEFRNTGDGGKVLTPIGSTQSVPYDSTTVSTYSSNKSAMIAAVQQTTPATNTPLAETLYTGLRYIAQLPQPYGTTTYLYPLSSSPAPSFPAATNTAGSLGPSEIIALSGTETCPAGYITNACGRDPYFFGSNPTPAWASPSQQVTCCRTFVMILTDGEPTTDTNIPVVLQDYAHAAHGIHCTGSSSAIPPPAGTCGTNTAIPAATLLQQHKTDYSSASHALDDVAYWGHKNDLRQATVPVINEAGHDLPGFQNATIYTFFAFGNINGRELLMQSAKQGGFEDQNGNNVPDLQSEWDKVDNSTGLLAPDGIPDTYFESSSADDIHDKLLSTLTSMLQKAASGTSVSVLASSSTGEGAVYQAYFFPTTFNNVGATTTEVKWTGYTQSLFVDFFGNLREDFSGPACTGPPDGKLILTHDCIVKLRVDPATGNVVVDRFKDINGDGSAESATPYQTVTLREIQPIWEAGRRLALTDPAASCPANTGGVTCRRILTWMDISNGGGVGPSGEEYGEFAPGRVGYLCPYMGGALANGCNSGNAATKTAAVNEATNIINFVRGFQVAGLRDRQLNVLDDSGAAVTRVWKLGDIVNSTPVIAAAPHERYDVIYGDSTYAPFFKRYKDRRNVAYVGGNDGMLHAFNAGFFTAGDDTSTAGAMENARFTTVPMQPGTSSPCSGLPCDASVTQYASRSNNPKLGAELWAFIPHDLLPQLRWMTMPGYDHIYYVDLTPKVTEARIFANDADHPGGWGTILIGGFRLGGSCTNCNQGKSGPRVVNADFNYDGDITDTGNGTSGSDTRVFLSSYFVLDVTNPEKDPVLLWTFRDKDLGLTTAAPAVLRVNPASDASISSVNEKWYVVFGSGSTHIDGSSSQTARMFIVDLKLGPSYPTVNQTSGSVGGTVCSVTSPCIAPDTSGAGVTVVSTGQSGAAMGNAVTLDYELDYRVDVIYAGLVACNGATPSPCNGSGPQWRGAMYRLTTNYGDTDLSNWGLSGAPTKLISNFTYSSPQALTCANASPCKVGPVLSAPALSMDNANNLWVFFGTGRFYSNNDKLTRDMQHFYGVKDCIISGSCTDQTIERNNVLNVSNVVVCTICSGNQVSGVSGVTNFDGFSNSLVGAVNAMDGWVTTLPTAGERNVSAAKILGGNVFFTTFVPTADICVAIGQGQLYGVFYLTGSAYKDSVIGTTPSGPDTLVNRSIALDVGLPSEIAIQIGAQGSGAAGASGNAGSIGRVTGFVQGSEGVLAQLGIRPAFAPWSRIIAWRDL